MSLALELNTSARALMSIANDLSKATSSAGTISDDLILRAQDQLTAGALAVRGLGGSHFAKEGEHMFQTALRLDASPTRVNQAITAAMDGASMLLTRASYR